MEQVIYILGCIVLAIISGIILLPLGIVLLCLIIGFIYGIIQFIVYFIKGE